MWSSFVHTVAAQSSLVLLYSSLSHTHSYRGPCVFLYRWPPSASATLSSLNWPYRWPFLALSLHLARCLCIPDPFMSVSLVGQSFMCPLMRVMYKKQALSWEWTQLESKAHMPEWPVSLYAGGPWFTSCSSYGLKWHVSVCVTERERCAELFPLLDR